MKLQDIMSIDVETVDPAASVQEMAARMKRRNIGALPVVQGVKPIGIVTDRDIALRAVASGADITAMKVRDVMSHPACSIYQDQSVHDACELMERQKIRRVLVLDRDNDLVGLISLNDIATKTKSSDRTVRVLKSISAV